MRILTALLLFAALSVTPAPHSGAALGSAVSGHSAVTTTHSVWTTTTSVVEPADADADAGGSALHLPSTDLATVVSWSPPTAPRHRWIRADVPALPRPHLLERDAHPSTAPPVSHA